MGKKDILTKQYLAQDDVFADAFNYYFFDGEEVIKPEELKEQDATELAVIDKMNKVFTSQKMRDVLKLCNIKRSKYATMVLLGIEGQTNIHYAMPVRDYLYDALNYASQVENIRKQHEDNKDLSGDERISGFSREDHILPVITLCICFDKKKWDAPRSLFDMFGDIDPRIAKYVDDYRLNLITPDEIEDFDKFSSELGKIMEAIQISDDSEKLHDIIVSGNDELKVKTVEMMNMFAGTRISTDNAKGGQVMVSKAWQELVDAERKIGREEGISEGADMLAKLLKVLVPGSKEFDKALNATAKERMKLYKKYGILD
jgi:Fe-S-cluster formation regulator IscX/YfhJ